MAKKSKLATPEWILGGYDSEEDWEKAQGKKTDKKKTLMGKMKKIKICPKCGSYDVGVVLSGNDFEEESNTGNEWECRKCKWKGGDIDEKEISEDEFIKITEEK